eukprot:UN06686
MFEPYFPWYPSYGRQMKITWIELKPPHFLPTVDEIKKVMTPKTKAILLNSPHNPTGAVMGLDLLKGIAELCIKNNVLCVSDEVYENCLFGGKKHYRIADLDGMFERTLSVHSASKLFGLTGWRVGWIIGPENFLAGNRTYHA